MSIITVETLFNKGITEKEADILFIDLNIGQKEGPVISDIVESIVSSVSIPVLFNDASSNISNPSEDECMLRWDGIVRKIEAMANT